MQELFAYYQQLYDQSLEGSACETAALYILWALGAGGLPEAFVASIEDRLSECRDMVRSVGAVDRFSGSCHGLTLGDYYRQQIAVYEQFLAALATV